MSTPVKVPFVNLSAQYEPLRKEILETVDRIFASGNYILGAPVLEFEKLFAEYSETRYAIAVANATDAISLVLKALNIGPGDEVITAPNSFLASAGAIANVGATIRFCDIDETLNLDPKKLEAAITPKTKAVLPVHFTGLPADMDAIRAIAKRHDIAVIEDAAQAVGARYKGRRVGGLGNAACFSLHPLKNLHLYGDGGIITTDDPKLNETLLQLRNHGLINRDESVRWGLNSRLDSVHAAIGSLKMKYLDGYTERFQEIARRYTAAFRPLEANQLLRVPVGLADSECVFHNYIMRVKNRDKLQAYLTSRGVETKIHYPIPIHLQIAAKDTGYGKGSFPVTEKYAQEILSLPIYPELTDSQIKLVTDSITDYFREQVTSEKAL